MPELPEVETVRAILKPHIVGKTIAKVDILVPRIVTTTTDLETFKSSLVGKTVSDVTRIGKYLIFHYSDDVVVISHLRMEGKYVKLKPGAPISKYTCVVFTFTDGNRLVYNDTRKFGTMELATEATYRLSKSLAKLGPEPWDITYDHFYQQVTLSSRKIKEVLLDQSVITGLGNIYVDEILFKSKIHPETAANTLTKIDADLMLDNTRTTLNEAILAGGTTVRSYQPAEGITGLFQLNLFAYGRAGEPCLKCQNLLKKIRVGGRGTTYCPHCQKHRNRPSVVGITGVVGSGKSALLKYYHDHGYFTLSSDEEIALMYKDEEIKQGLVAIFGENILLASGEVNKELLRGLISENGALKSELEDYLYPLLKERLLKIRDESSAKIIFFEIPLLYEGKFETICDYVIGVKISEENQIKNLTKRGADVKKALELNATNKFEKNSARVDFLIDNNADLACLYAEAEKILTKIK